MHEAVDALHVGSPHMDDVGRENVTVLFVE